MQSRVKLSITQIVFLGPSQDKNEFEKLTQKYDQLRCEEGKIYCIVDPNSNQPFFSMKWPKEYVYGGLNQENFENFAWISSEQIPFLASLNECKEEEGKLLPWIIGVIEEHIDLVLQRIEIAKQAKCVVRDLFTEEQEESIERFFGTHLLDEVKELKTLLCPNDQWELKNDPGDALKFARLVTALKATPPQKMTPHEASENPAVQEIAHAAAALREWLRLTEEDDGHHHKDGVYNRARWISRHKLIVRIITSILLIAPGALAGFKAGAALGATVGGGVFSVPSAMIGGCTGALLGGGLGLFGGRYIWKKLADSERECGQDVHSALVDMAVQAVLPPAAF
ncbi:MAG: hypothetical protein K0S27_1372 [Gammaproteobacteria bacterium]|jgi:hypothetical protein|nr:hypothetical protein [Gammaproteobacteria bacterium]